MFTAKEQAISAGFPLWIPADSVYGGSSAGGSQPSAQGCKALVSVMAEPSGASFRQGGHFGWPPFEWCNSGAPMTLSGG